MTSIHLLCLACGKVWTERCCAAGAELRRQSEWLERISELFCGHGLPPKPDCGVCMAQSAVEGAPAPGRP